MSLDVKGFILFYIAYASIVLIFAFIAYDALMDMEMEDRVTGSWMYEHNDPVFDYQRGFIGIRDGNECYVTIYDSTKETADRYLRDIERLGGTVTQGPDDGIHVTCFRTIHWYREAQI